MRSRAQHGRCERSDRSGEDPLRPRWPSARLQPQPARDVALAWQPLFIQFCLAAFLIRLYYFPRAVWHSRLEPLAKVAIIGGV